MEIRNTRPEELDEVMEIYEKARQVMRSSGNMNQWINGYPSRELIREDIASGYSYVMTDQGGIHAVFTLIDGEDPTYKVIENGQWLNDKLYVTIHRIASNGTYAHSSDICYDWALSVRDNLRIDTHQDNCIMRHVLDRNGFTECGTIYVSDGSPRIAYQKEK